MAGDKKSIINPKFEIRNSKQIQMTKIQMTETKAIALSGGLILF